MMILFCVDTVFCDDTYIIIDIVIIYCVIVIYCVIDTLFIDDILLILLQYCSIIIYGATRVVVRGTLTAYAPTPLRYVVPCWVGITAFVAPPLLPCVSVCLCDCRLPLLLQYCRVDYVRWVVIAIVRC